MSDRVVTDGDMTLTSTIDGEGNAVIRLGQNPVIEPLNVTENGVYSVPEGVDGYSPVTVAIPEYDGAYKVEPSTEEQTLATAGKVMTGDVTVGKAESGSSIRLYSSKEVETNASYSTFNNFQQALLPDLPLDKDFVMIDFENNTSNSRAGIFWTQVRTPKANEVVSAGKRVGGSFSGSYGCDVYAGATINVYVGDY